MEALLPHIAMVGHLHRLIMSTSNSLRAGAHAPGRVTLPSCRQRGAYQR